MNSCSRLELNLMRFNDSMPIVGEKSDRLVGGATMTDDLDNDDRGRALQDCRTSKKISEEMIRSKKRAEMKQTINLITNEKGVAELFIDDDDDEH